MYRAPLCAGRKSGKNPPRERDCRSRELSRASPASYFHPFQRGLGAPPLANGAESQRRTHIRRSCRPRWSDPCLRIRPPRADGPWRTNRRTFDEGREPVGGRAVRSRRPKLHWWMEQFTFDSDGRHASSCLRYFRARIGLKRNENAINSTDEDGLRRTATTTLRKMRANKLSIGGRLFERRDKTRNLAA